MVSPRLRKRGDTRERNYTPHHILYSMLAKLNLLLTVPLEQWLSHGVSLKAASANANGQVNSGITSQGVYFFRKWTNGTSSFVLG